MLKVVEETSLSPAGVLYGLAGIILVRAFLEVFSSPTSSGFPPLDAATLIHYALFYIAAYLLFALILGFFAGGYAKAAKVALFGMTILWLPPVIDLIATGGAGSTMTYLFDSPALLLQDLLTFFGPMKLSGVTLGIRVEAVLMMCGVGWYVYQSKKSLIRAVAAAGTAYLAMFTLISLPAVVFALASLGGSIPGAGPLSFFLSWSQDAHLIANILPGTLGFGSSQTLIEAGFNKILSLLLVPMIAIFGLLLVWNINRSIFLAHLRNIRPLRALHYTVMIIGGVLLGTRGNFYGYGFLDVLALLSLILAWASAWMVAVCVNDIHDQPIDAISNANRPLIAGTATESDVRSATPVFLIFSLLAAWASGYYPFIFLVVFTACYFIYSAPPLRLKRIPGLASVLIGFALLSSVLAGFFLASPDKSLAALPGTLLFGIVLCYTLALNARDLKDVRGDAAAGIATVPTFIAKRFGERNAFRVTGVLVALGLLLSPFFIPVPGLLIPAGIAAMLAYLACVRQPYREMPLLLINFGYLFWIAIAFLLG